MQKLSSFDQRKKGMSKDNEIKKLKEDFKVKNDELAQEKSKLEENLKDEETKVTNLLSSSQHYKEQADRQMFEATRLHEEATKYFNEKIQLEKQIEELNLKEKLAKSSKEIEIGKIIDNSNLRDKHKLLLQNLTGYKLAFEVCPKIYAITQPLQKLILKIENNEPYTLVNDKDEDDWDQIGESEVKPNEISYNSESFGFDSGIGNQFTNSRIGGTREFDLKALKELQVYYQNFEIALKEIVKIKRFKSAS
jgi:hypothetical protein